MIDCSTAPSAASGYAIASLSRRRALFATLVIATIAGLLWLAATTVPPRSAGGILFLAFFAVTLPWSTVGFWNACIGLVIMTGSRDPVASVNPMAAHIRGDEKVTAPTAILMCVRNESPRNVMRNLTPLLEGLATAPVAHLFHLYVLSLSLADLSGVDERVFHALPNMARNFYTVPAWPGHERNLMAPDFAADRCDRVAEGQDCFWIPSSGFRLELS